MPFVSWTYFWSAYRKLSSLVGLMLAAATEAGFSEATSAF
jgi:hypothetical protein